MFIKNLGITGIATVVTQLLNMLFWLAIARLFSESELGAVSLVIGTALIFVILCDSFVVIILQKSNLETKHLGLINLFVIVLSLVFFIFDHIFTLTKIYLRKLRE